MDLGGLRMESLTDRPHFNGPPGCFESRGGSRSSLGRLAGCFGGLAGSQGGHTPQLAPTLLACFFSLARSPSCSAKPARCKFASAIPGPAIRSNPSQAVLLQTGYRQLSEGPDSIVSTKPQTLKAPVS